jgi:hypothetical protein
VSGDGEAREVHDAGETEALDEARARYQHAATEVARLSRADDHGSGERTARLASLGAWETALEAARAEVERLSGRPWPPPAATGD